MTEIYHITHLENLRSTIAVGGLYCKNELSDRGLLTQNIAHTHIQNRRRTRLVSCGPGGSLHDYVPFYFAPRSPMLYAIHKENVATYRGGQASILHLVTTIQVIVASRQSWVFTDGHAAMDYSDFYNDLDLLSEVIDWDLMKSKYWFSTNDDPDRKRRRQAEFLVYRFVPWPLIQHIGVINRAVAEKVRDRLPANGRSPQIVVRPSWYY